MGISQHLDPRTRLSKDIVPFTITLPSYGMLKSSAKRLSTDAENALLKVLTDRIVDEMVEMQTYTRRALSTDKTGAVDDDILAEIPAMFADLQNQFLDNAREILKDAKKAIRALDPPKQEPERFKLSVNKHDRLRLREAAFLQASQSLTAEKPANKKRKADGDEQRAAKRLVSFSPIPSPIRSPGNSRTLEPDQILPGTAYFHRQDTNEELAWRCGIKHCLGVCYNAGDRKYCKGCGTNISVQKSAVVMDFFLPPTTFIFQPTTAYKWTPSALSRKPRSSQYGSHNAIAKDAYWSASILGLSDEDSRAKAVEAIHSFLASKSIKKSITTEAPPKSLSPVPDLGPHPSGSSSMEHGQDLPFNASFSPFSPSDRYAWRCDITHALGRYYMAGDKRSCPGCGSYIAGGGKKATMDFYLPSACVVRQFAPLHLQDWQPKRKPNTKKRLTTHNQFANSKYWTLVEQGVDHDDAVKEAIKLTDEYLDTQAEKQLKSEDEESVVQEDIPQQKQDESDVDTASGANDDASLPAPVVFSLNPDDQNSDAQTPSRDPTPDTSTDEDTSSSDSE